MTTDREKASAYDCPACGNPILDCTCHDDEDVCDRCGECLSDCDCDEDE